MKKIITVIAALFVAMTIAFSASYASAAPTATSSVGGVVYNQTISNGKIIAKDPTGFKRDVWPGRSSEWVGIYDADYFWVPGGCDTWSQWGYKYVGNRWYGKLPNDALLSLKVIC